MIAALLLAAVISADTLPWAGIVDSAYSGTAGVVSAAGVPMFRTIGDALTQLPVNGGTRTVIFVRNGHYHEKLTVDRPRVTLRGQSRSGVFITYDAAADTPAPGGSTYGTRGSYTLRVVAPDFRAEHLTIENTFDYMANAAKAATDPTKVKNAQAVALMTDLGSDRAVFDDVRILGHQDTLFANSGRAWFHDCEVAGSVDFIFGAGQAVFEDCDITSRDRKSADNNGYITAASTDTSHVYGFLFIHDHLRKERPEMAANSVTLGRPWHPFADPRANASSVFIECEMDDHIGAKGWDRMSSVDSTGTRIWYEPESARFFEYGTTGPGNVKSTSRRVLSKRDAARYTRVAVLAGWDPMPSADADKNARRARTNDPTRGWTADQSAWGNQGSVGRVEELFEGRFPGVRVFRQAGGFSVQIRGTMTFNGNTEPMYVIDGFAIEPGPDRLIGINPADVARIEVLKDAASLAMYGSRAGNGVVLITTKRPK
jgi:pectinesterase